MIRPGTIIKLRSNEVLEVLDYRNGMYRGLVKGKIRLFNPHEIERLIKTYRDDQEEKRPYRQTYRTKSQIVENLYESYN